MTRPLTPHADALVDALPHAIAVQVRPTSRLDYNVDRAIREQHWTIAQLAAEATRDLDSAVVIGGVINDRIEVCATIPPPKAKTRTGLAKVHDGCCEDGWIYDESVDPVRTIKCPGVLRGAS